jgi:hypothetical protein
MKINLLIPLVLTISASAASQTLPQPPEFTRQELLAAMNFFLPPEKAEKAADSLLLSPPIKSGGALSDTATGGRHVSGITFARDMLILLSFLSPETNAKVEAYRRQSTAASKTPAEDEASWAARKDELRNLAEVKKWLAEVRR